MITIKDTVRKTVLDIINTHDLIKKDEKIILGISGGPDSASLLYILHELKDKYNLKFMLAHVNHKLRGKESDKDEKFVKSLARRYNISLKVKRVDIPALKKKNKKLSVEELGRRERHTFFRSLLKKYKFDKIALGHNLDDHIENFFLSFLNGGSLRSLAGLKPAENSIIRPLIGCYKKDLEKFLKYLGLSWRTDGSNKNNSFPRNWVRNKLIPYIENNYKPVKKNISHLLDILNRENDFIESACEGFYNKNIRFNKNFYSVLIKKDDNFINHPAFLRRIVKKIFWGLEKEYNFRVIDETARFMMDDGKQNSRMQIGNELFFWKTKEFIIVTSSKYLKGRRISLNKTLFETEIRGLNMKVSVKEVDKKDFNPADRGSLYFDKAKINEIIIRQKKISDYIILLNTDFKKTLKSLFVDLKIALPLRKAIPVIESNNEVIGIYLNLFPVFLNNRVSEKYKVTETTEKIIKMEFKQNL